MMKLIPVFCLISLSVFCQVEKKVLQQAEELINAKKYNSAFKLLDSFDSSNNNPETTLLKTKIVCNYFIMSINHRMFELKDLGPNEDIMDYRGKEHEGKISVYFSADEILTNLIKNYPQNYRLYKGLGDFYYDIYLRYGNSWENQPNGVLNLAAKNYIEAINHQLESFQAYYVVGLSKLIDQKSSESEPFFIKAIEFQPNEPNANYNLAIALKETKDLKKALFYALRAIDFYVRKDYKADAAFLTADIYSQQEDLTNALIYYEKGNEIMTKTPRGMRALLYFYLKTNNKKSENIREEIFITDPKNPGVYNELYQNYSRNKKLKELLDFYLLKLKEFDKDLNVKGNLFFYIGDIYQVLKDNSHSKEYYLKAKESFTQVFDKNHPVFEAIEKALKEL